MNPFSGFANEIEMQMKVKKGQCGLVLLQDLLDKVAVCRIVLEQNFDRFDPRFIDFPPANFLIAVSEMKADKTYDFLGIAGFDGFSQKWNGHRFDWLEISEQKRECLILGKTTVPWLGRMSVKTTPRRYAGSMLTALSADC
jgi:hypothetical protein